MRITNVEGLHLRLPRTKATTDGPQDALLVRISTDAGVTGWGEVDASPYVAKAVIDAPPSHTLANGLRTLLIGEDPLDTDRLWSRMYEGTLYYGRDGVVIPAMAGVDLALWDIKGKAAGEPVHRLLNGGYRTSVRAYAASPFAPTPAATAERARAARDAGYTAVEFGWEPFGEDPDQDCAFLEAIRRAIGEDMELMVDAGHAWDARTTLERARLFDPYHLFWIEEPLHPDDLDGYAVVSHECEIPIAAGEEECTVAGLNRLMEIGRVDLLQVDPSRVGLTQAMTVAMLAQSSGVPIVSHGFTTGVNAAASLHLLTASHRRSAATR